MFFFPADDPTDALNGAFNDGLDMQATHEQRSFDFATNNFYRRDASP